ncbi:Chain length determinant protein [Rhizobium tibeticum]|uniref:Chain length determinant protein n=1 Tax=Rhizobium tibeticum TaxID=501024 RepID=A0A1H8NRZ6_9HYPH|nr:Wzz/FepE/Etk N-terminal domain-containing protein [Rhizobium tibeticum]SEI00657.1 putative tyrosine-protein kinase in cps region [Rhizobium tibeticum]SEO32339.1 Chain length determinant protein [Rhizobium tibeticum]
MMFNNPRPLDPAARLWRLNEVQPERTEDGPIALLRYLIVLGYRYKIALLACTLAGLLLAGLYARSLPPTYNAVATLLLEPRQSAASGQEWGPQQSLDTSRADSELQTIKSERLLSAVFESLNLRDTPELGPRQPGLFDPILSFVRTLFRPTDRLENGKVPRASAAVTDLANDAERAAFSNFAQRLDVRRVGQSFVIEIEYSASDPALPARVANGVVSGYLFQAVSFKEQTERAGTDALQGRLDALALQVDAAREGMQAGALPAIPTPDAGARVIGAALPPLSPSGPRRSLIVALGGVLGLLGGLGLIAVNLALDRKVRNANDLSRDAGIPCLGSVPDVPGANAIPWRIDTPRQQRFVAAIHDLRTSIEIACTSLRNDRSIAVAVVSWSPGTGVTTLSSALAQLMSRSGRGVTLFQAATRDVPAALDGSVPPTTSLAGAVFANLLFSQLSFDHVGGVSVLPIHSKDTNANLFADFRDARVQQIIDAARQKGDVVLDLPPIEGSMDALALASFADAVIVLALAGETTIEEVGDCIRQLRRAGANVVGTVVNKAHS